MANSCRCRRAEAFAGFIEPEFRSVRNDRVKGTVVGDIKGAFKKEDNHGLWSVKSENPGGNVSLGTDFIYYIPGKGKNMSNADHYDVMRMYRLADKAINQMARFQKGHDSAEERRLVPAGYGRGTAEAHRWPREHHLSPRV